MYRIEVLIDAVHIEIELVFDVIEGLVFIVHIEETRDKRLLCIFNGRQHLLLFIAFIIGGKETYLLIMGMIGGRRHHFWM